DGNDSQLTMTADDPRTLLRCPPQELTGEWTPDKWDYWLQTAREAESLAQDELALARQGMMTGLCNGKSTFVTSVDSRHLQATFQHLAAKLQQQFEQAEIDLKIDSSVQAEDKTPERRQQKRMVQAKSLAETKLLNTPVMQYLLERGEGKMGKVQLY
ncbi:MAG: DNA polymerase III subunit gamma/tau, partial [Psychrobacter sp.]